MLQHTKMCECDTEEGWERVSEWRVLAVEVSTVNGRQLKRRQGLTKGNSGAEIKAN
jgi:hypothetical protein